MEGTKKAGGFREVKSWAREQEQIKQSLEWMARGSGDLAGVSPLGRAALAALGVEQRDARQAALKALGSVATPADAEALAMMAIGSDDRLRLDDAIEAFPFDAAHWRWAPLAGFLGKSNALEWLVGRGCALETPEGESALGLLAQRLIGDSYDRKPGQAEVLKALSQPELLARLSSSAKIDALNAVGKAYEKLADCQVYNFDQIKRDALEASGEVLARVWSALDAPERSAARRGSMALMMAGLDLDAVAKAPDLAARAKKDKDQRRDYEHWDLALPAREELARFAQSVDWAAEEERARASGWTLYRAPIHWAEEKERWSRYRSDERRSSCSFFETAWEGARKVLLASPGEAPGLLSREDFGNNRRLALSSPLGRSLVACLGREGLNAEECLATMEDFARRVRACAAADLSKPAGRGEEDPKKEFEKEMKSFEWEMMALYGVSPVPAWAEILNHLANAAGVLDPRSEDLSGALDTFGERAELAVEAMRAAMKETAEPQGKPARRNPTRV